MTINLLNCITRNLFWVAGFAVILLSSGCDAPVARYEQNRVFWAKQNRGLEEKLTADQRQNLVNIMDALFGTPDEPVVPQLANLDLSKMMDVSKLEQSAGPVGRDEDGRKHGLYREHCVHCHGVTGNGRGPTASFSNPYPRDFTRGAFKFKSTPSLNPPTHDDLTRILRNGVAGTAMPSFKLLDGDEVESLVQYVKYLSLRGEVERQLIVYLAGELDPGQLMLNLTDEETRNDQLDMVRGVVEEVASKWMDAASTVTPIEQRAVTDNPLEMAQVENGRELLSESVERGRHLFYGEANCVKCHGTTALGDGVRNDYDIWNKELEPDNPEALEDFLALGALPPRHIIPRNLREGVYRGGRRPIDLFWRVRNGITASTMPEQAKLTDEQVWDIVNYVRSLPYEAASEPREDQPSFKRDRS